MIVNKTALALTSPMALAGFQPAGTARVYRYSAAHLAGIVREANQAMTATGFTGVFPPSSITLVVADQATVTAASTLTIAKSGTGSGAVGGGGTYAYNTRVTPTATAATGSTLTGWSPTGCAGAFALTANTTCTHRHLHPQQLRHQDGCQPGCAPNPVPHGLHLHHNGQRRLYLQRQLHRGHLCADQRHGGQGRHGHLCADALWQPQLGARLQPPQRLGTDQ